MKRVLVLLSCIAALVLLTAPTAVEKAPLTINGRLLGNMVVVEGGIWAISLEDVSRALGSSVSLEPSLQLHGNILSGKASTGDIIKKTEAGALVPAVNKADSAQKVNKAAPGQFLKIQNGGQISSHVTMFKGKAYIPVADLVRAFGDGSVRGTFTGPLQPGGLNLHINSNTNGIIAVLIGL